VIYEKIDVIGRLSRAFGKKHNHGIVSFGFWSNPAMRQPEKLTEHTRKSVTSVVLPEFKEGRPSYGKSDYVMFERRGEERRDASRASSVPQLIWAQSNDIEYWGVESSHSTTAALIILCTEEKRAGHGVWVHKLELQSKPQKKRGNIEHWRASTVT
jgi:hypothetical protein